ncbi:MAG: hypothetical protein GOVbin1782_57 [Prokaryotic dsDNA virus sp.]|nr:MAG: hypothetical protein GOVbin1782_57 [Prokaryotic dsDNA virus sp.]|tara:strand:- start:623 stop:823 length:201 start_codon:yes stop_codon:yes gene_type:complete
MNAEDIASHIVNLTMRLDNQKELKKAWQVISKALLYLSAKDDFFTREQESLEIIGRMKEERLEDLV